MGDAFKLPDKKAVVFWPVGTGDSTTLILKPNDLLMQIDLHHMEKSDDDDNPEWPIIDHLVKLLPKKNKRPYLGVFVLTHPDKDHIKGFAELLKKVDIGEIWHTPKIFRALEDKETLCDDAKAFRKEAHRRRKAILDDPDNIKSGDRLRVIGHDDILKEDEYKDLPDNCKSRPGDKLTTLDGEKLSSFFETFVHAPFKDDQEEDKNSSSLSLNIRIWESDKCGQFFFFGDREYSNIKRIFETTEKNKKNIEYLKWDVMLCAHHCSKAVMYCKDEDDDEEKFQKDIMDYFEAYTNEGYIVSSSSSDFTDGQGDNPPHKKARKRYEKIAASGHFICTHEYPDKENPEPLVFTIESTGLVLDEKRNKGQGPAGLASAAAIARGSSQPPGKQIGFGV